MSTTDEHELALREHIRRLLLDYALTHLTINHVTYTEEAVSELLSKHLKQIPEHDSFSFTLPVDPFHTLSAKLKLKELQPYDLKWTVDKSVLDYIKNAVGSSERGKQLKTLRVWDEEEKHDETTDYVNLLYRPMSPILTRAAMRETSYFRKKKDSKCYSFEKFGSDLPGVLKRLDIASVDMIPYPQDKKIKIEDALDLKLTIAEDMHTSIVSYLKTSLQPQVNKKDANQHFKNFLRSNDEENHSPNRSNIIHPISPPIFERSRRMARYLNDIDYGMETLKEVAEKVPLLDMKDEEIDIAEENMAIVNGWNAYTEPISQSDLDTPSLADSSSQIDELDEDLWLASSSQNSVQTTNIKILTEAKMDIIIFPRAETLRAVNAEDQKHIVFDSILENKSLSSFIPSLAPPSGTRLTDSYPKSSTDSSSPPRNPSISISMLGQAPSELDSNIYHHGSGAEVLDDFDSVLKRMYKDVEQESRGGFGAIILKEKVDDKEGMLMDVPIMPRPRKYEPDPSLPKDLNTLVSETPECAVTFNPTPIKKVTGVKPLNIELSWRPFNFGAKIPTHEEVIDVANALCINEDETNQSPYILDESQISKVPTIEAYTSTPDNVIFIKYNFDAKADFILTRAERKRLTQTSGHPLDNANSQPSSVLDIDDSFVGYQDAQDISEPGRKKFKEFVTADRSGNYDEDIQQAAFDNNVSISKGSSQVRSVTRDSVPVAPEEDNEGLPLTPPFFSDMALTPPDTLMHEPTFTDISKMLAHDLVPYEYDMPFDIKQISRNDEMPLSLPDNYSSHNWQNWIAPDNDMELEPSLIQDDSGISILNTSKLSDVQSTELKLDDFAALKCDKLSLMDFLRMRGKDELTKAIVPSNILEPEPQYAVDLPVSQQPPVLEVHDTPDELMTNTMTLQLPEIWNLPTVTHKYMASVDLIQKNNLRNSLESDLCGIELIERENLFGVDMILTPDAAVIFFSLAALPSQCAALCSQLVSLSWSYLDILVIFEAFPSSYLYRSDTSSLKHLYAYSPPVIKAIKKLRRDLSLYEGADEKNAQCTIRLAYANTVEEAAIFARAFGDGIIDCHVPSCNYIDWLTPNNADREDELAATSGMNAFAACIMLNNCTLDDLLSMPVEQRTQLFAPLVGTQRINYLNMALNQHVALDPLIMYNTT